MGEGKQTDSSIPPDVWNYPEPGSIGETLYNKICEEHQ